GRSAFGHRRERHRSGARPRRSRPLGPLRRNSPAAPPAAPAAGTGTVESSARTCRPSSCFTAADAASGLSERDEGERREVERRWRALLASRPTVADLVDFHTRTKMTLLARSPDAYRDLGRLVARASARPLPEVLADYGAGLHEALAQPTTPARN